MKIVPLDIDKLLTPTILKILLILRITWKWLFRSVTVLNVIVAIWIFHFNTPFITAILIA